MAKTRNYHLKMPPDGYEALQEIADNERRVFADVVREALEQYVKSKTGNQISFAVERGGNRRTAKTESEG